MISVHFQGKPFNITVIQAYAPTSNAEEVEVERFYEDLQDLLELTPQKDVLFIIGDWNAKLGSQETPGVGDGQGDLACCSSWHRKKSDMTERLHFHFSLCIPVPYNEKDIFLGC